MTVLGREADKQTKRYRDVEKERKKGRWGKTEMERQIGRKATGERPPAS